MQKFRWRNRRGRSCRVTPARPGRHDRYVRGRLARRAAVASPVRAASGASGARLIAAAGASTPAVDGCREWTDRVDTSSTGLLSTNFWLASAQGDVWNFGHAAAYGSAGGLPLAHPIVAITPTNDDRGYWLVASDGGVFTYGDAAFYGSTGAWP